MLESKKTFLNSSYLLWFGIPVFIYQVLTARIISQIFGDLFYVQLMIIAVSYLGHSLGSLCSNRGWFRLYSSHLALCICNLSLILIWNFSSSLLIWGKFALWLTAFVFFLVSFFSSLLFPLLFSHPQQPRKNFNILYFWFHFLVVFALYAVDLLALGSWGLTAIFWGLLAMDLAWALYWYIHRESTRQNKGTFTAWSQQRDLFIFSIFSGITQGLIYRQVQSFIAPLSFHYDIFLSGLLLGWSLASVWFLKSERRFGFSLESFKNRLPLLLTALTLWAFSWPVIWSAGLFLFNNWNGHSLGIRTLFAMGLILPCAFFFGSLIPLFHRNNPLTPIGQLLAVNSAGNAAGVLLYSLFLFQWALPFQIWIALVISACFYIQKYSRLLSYSLMAVLAFFILALTQVYNWNLGSYQYRDFSRWMELSQTITQTDVFKSKGSEVTLATTLTGSKMLFMNGHYSVLIPPSMKVAPADIMMGLPALHYVKKTQDALVIGLGTGFTARGAAQVFDKLDIVDIDTAMVHLTNKITSPELLKNKRVHFIEADGLTYLRSSLKKYDLIINNVPSPVYFAAGKLWTAEAFAAIFERLDEDGVFFQWLSAEFSDSDLSVVFNTMQSYFSHCDLYTLTYGFHGLVCAKKNNTLTFHPAIASKLSSLLNLSVSDYLDLLDAISFKSLTLPQQRDSDLVHLLDKPYLETQTSWHPPGWSHDFDGIDYVFQRFHLRQKLDAELSPEQLKEKCERIARWYGIRDSESLSCQDLGL